MPRLRYLLIVLLALGVGYGVRKGYRSHQRTVLLRGQSLYRESVIPLIRQSCLRCHGPEAQKGQLRLDTLASVLKGGASGPALVPGEPDKSLMLLRVRHNDPRREPIPKDAPTDEEIDAIRRWIADGAPWIERHEKVATSQEKQSERIGNAWNDPRNPITKIFGGKRLDLWSLKPIANPKTPEVKNTAWVRNDIDRFILANMEKANQQPAPEASARVLARRLYVDLTGLPPTPEQMEAYLADKSPDAYSRLVQQLLNSPAYGENWARMWLDVVRYSDSNGFDYDEFRPTAWRFRDYAVSSFNRDKPFDRFVQEQLAGDEMVAGEPQDIAEQECLSGTGFMRIGPYDNSASKFGERDRCRAQVMSDLVETTTAAFMGLNFNCCRCHDHKIDPFAQSDYYRLRAFFEATKPNDEIALDLPAQAKVIEQENLAIDRAKQAIRDIENPIFARLRKAHAAALPEDKRKLLKLSFEDASEFTREQIRLVKKGIEPELKDVLATLSPSEKATHDKATAALEDLQRKRTAPMRGFLITDSNVNLQPTHILFQGDFAQPREKVVAGIPSALDPNPISPVKVARENTTGRRTALAKWLVSKENPFTARAIVNRVWLSHFGSGIVATPNDFGYSGARPSHPELLDWLASRLISDGWSLKKLHQLIVESAAYRQGLATQVCSTEVALFHSQPPRRMAAEAIRDALLQISGLLKPSAGGPPVWPELPKEVLLTSPSALIDDAESLRGWYTSPLEQTYVRSIYLVHKRSLHVPMLDTFDLPDNNVSCACRTTSTVAPQALTLLNSEFMQQVTHALAKRLQSEVGTDPEKQFARAFALALQRQPDADEQRTCLDFLHRHGLRELCRSLLNLNEFAYVD